MSIQVAIKAAEDNIANYVSAKKDPAMYNVNVALLNIALALQRLQNDVDGMERTLKRIKSA